jgi:hypothetical protein
METHGGSIEVWIAAIAATVATMAFLLSLWIRLTTERELQLRKWQRVVVYSIIQDLRRVSFEELKQRYLQSAQQFLTRSVPKAEIQDDALKLALLELQKENAIVRNSDLKYYLATKDELPADVMRSLTSFVEKDRMKMAITRLVEKDSGVYTPDSLTRRLTELGYDVSFSMVDDLVYEMRGLTSGSIKMGKDNKLMFIPPYEERDVTS